jgi:hypothetical protein
VRGTLIFNRDKVPHVPQRPHARALLARTSQQLQRCMGTFNTSRRPLHPPHQRSPPWKKSQTCRCSVSRCPHAPRERGIDGRWRFACEFNSPTGTAWLHSQPLTRPTKGAEFLDMECPARACVSCRTRPSAPLYSCMHHVAVDLWH